MEPHARIIPVATRAGVLHAQAVGDLEAKTAARVVTDCSTAGVEGRQSPVVVVRVGGGIVSALVDLVLDASKDDDLVCDRSDIGIT